MKLCARAHAQEAGPKGRRRVLQGMGLEGEGLKLVYSTVWCSVSVSVSLLTSLARSTCLLGAISRNEEAGTGDV